MRRTKIDWRGYFAASPTPFTQEGELDLPSLRKVVSHFIEVGAHGIVINGSSGEWYAQQADEREAVAATAVAEVGGVVPAIVGVSSADPSDSERLIRHAVEIGADGVLLSPPPGWRLDTDEVLAFYERQCSTSDLPMILYNIPPDVATNLAPSTLDRLADLTTVVAVKESNRDDRQLYETCRVVGDRLRVFGNLMTRPGLGLMAHEWGADGYIGSGLLLGREQTGALEALWRGDTEVARETADRLNSLQADLDSDDGNGAFGGVPGQLKAVLNLMGQPAGYPRRPRLPVEGDNLAALRRTLVAHGLDPVA